MGFIVWFITQLIVTFVYLFTTMPNQDIEMGLRAFALSFVMTCFCLFGFIIFKYFILGRTK